jgi:hypothetical protein
LDISSHALIESQASVGHKRTWQALRVRGRLPLEIVEHRASLCCADMGNGGANAPDRSMTAATIDRPDR